MQKGYEILEGAIDLHIHGLPDIYKRPFDEIDIIRQAREFGYRALLFKSHFTANAGRMYVFKNLIDGIEFFGNVTLNLSVGGINPQAVYAAAQLGVKEVKMPTIHAANHIKYMGKPGYAYFKEKDEKSPSSISNIQGISVLSSEGKLLPQLYDIFDIIAKNDLILGTGHLSREEIMVLVKEAKDAGVQKILVTHADSDLHNLSQEDQAQLAGWGAYIEHTFTRSMPYKDIEGRPRINPKEIVANMKRVGTEMCIMATDAGQFENPFPFEGMRLFVQNMLRCGVKEKEIEMMIKTNPARLLGLH